MENMNTNHDNTTEDRMTVSIKITETGKIETLSLIDPKSGCDWISDMLGNHDALVFNDDGTGDASYIMTQSDYDWWSDLVERYQAADDRYHELLDDADDRDALLDAMSSEPGDYDLEHQPEIMQQVCDRFDTNNSDR